MNEGPEGFEEFWESYPRKVGKGDARRAWIRARPNAGMRAKIQATIRKMARCEQWTKNGGQYIPHPATWLNREGWEDEPEVTKAAVPPRQVTTCNIPGCRAEGAPIWGGRCAKHYAEAKAPLFAIK